MEQKHKKYEGLMARCQALTPVTIAVAYFCDETSLGGAVVRTVAYLRQLAKIAPLRTGAIVGWALA